MGTPWKPSDGMARGMWCELQKFRSSKSEQLLLLKIPLQLSDVSTVRKHGPTLQTPVDSSPNHSSPVSRPCCSSAVRHQQSAHLLHGRLRQGSALQLHLPRHPVGQRAADPHLDGGPRGAPEQGGQLVLGQRVRVVLVCGMRSGTGASRKSTARRWSGCSAVGFISTL